MKYDYQGGMLGVAEPQKRKRVIQANQEFYDRIAAFHDRTNSCIARQRCKRFYEALIKDALAERGYALAGKRVLELGCGSGAWYPLFASQGVGEYVGIDCSDNMIKEAKKRVSSFPGTHAQFLAADAEAYMAKSARERQKFDIIISFSFLHHIADPVSLLHKVEPVLVAQGAYFAFHEVNQKEPMTITKTLDALTAYLFGYDTVERSLARRMRWLGEKVVQRCSMGLLPIRKRGPEKRFDWVEYQLNSSTFSPHQFPGRVGGMSVEKVPYGYYVYGLLARLPGRAHDMFYLVSRKTT